MITLKLKNRSFKGNEKWPLLYIIAEILVIFEQDKKKIKNTEIVEIAKTKYNLAIERRTVKNYRKLIEDYFDIVDVADVYNSSNTTKKSDYCVDFNGFITKNGILTYGDFLKDQTINEKIKIIQKAIQNDLELRFSIDKYIVYKKNKQGENYKLDIVKHLFKTVPKKLFIHSKNVYLFAYVLEEEKYYIFKVNSLRFTNKSIIKNKHDIKEEDFDFNSYILQQDFIITGPLMLDYQIKCDNSCDHVYSSTMELYVSNTSSAFYDPFLYQSLIDLYNLDEISDYDNDVMFDYDEDSEFTYKEGNFLKLYLPVDYRTYAFLNRYKDSPKNEILFDRFSFDD